jgi:UMF1 family MFS transporter
MEIVPIYGLLGYLPPIQRLGFLGLQQAWEIFPLAIVYGFAMGGLSSYCRSFFGQLIPPGHEVAFYALFAITDKGSSAIGPAIVGRITDATGSIRPAFIFLFFLIGFPILLVRKVDEEKGRQEALGASLKIVEQEDIELHPNTAERSDIVERERLMGRNED